MDHLTQGELEGLYDAATKGDLVAIQKIDEYWASQWRDDPEGSAELVLPKSYAEDLEMGKQMAAILYNPRETEFLDQIKKSTEQLEKLRKNTEFVSLTKAEEILDQMGKNTELIRPFRPPEPYLIVPPLIEPPVSNRQVLEEIRDLKQTVSINMGNPIASIKAARPTQTRAKNKRPTYVILLSRQETYRHLRALCQNDQSFTICDYPDGWRDEDYEKIVISDQKLVEQSQTARGAVIGTVRLLPANSNTVITFVDKDAIYREDIPPHGAKLFTRFIKRAQSHFEAANLISVKQSQPMQENAGTVAHSKAGRKTDKLYDQAYEMTRTGVTLADARQWFFEQSKIKPDKDATKAFNTAIRRRRKATK